MDITSYHIRYYPSTEITCYPWVYHDREHTYATGETKRFRTGPYDKLKFDRLVESIREYGILNPFIIEYFDKHLPNAKGFQGYESLAIRTGNNRAEAMYQLGQTHGPALFVVPRSRIPELPEDSYREIPIDKSLQNEIRKLWKPVDGGELGPADAFNDCELLMDIIRGCEGD
jgi:hypothetical protein